MDRDELRDALERGSEAQRAGRHLYDAVDECLERSYPDCCERNMAKHALYVRMRKWFEVEVIGEDTPPTCAPVETE